MSVLGEQWLDVVRVFGVLGLGERRLEIGLLVWAHIRVGGVESGPQADATQMATIMAMLAAVLAVILWS